MASGFKTKPPRLSLILLNHNLYLIIML